MTFVQLQDRVLDRVNQNSTLARTRVKAFINERLRRIATSTNCAKVRFGSVSINTVDGTATVTTTGLVKVSTITIPAENKLLLERSPAQLRSYDPDASREGCPEFFAVEKFNPTTCLLRLQPIPDAVYALTIEGILTGTDLSADADVPGLPEDFHDILIEGALADEYAHVEKIELAAMKEAKFEQRLSDLKYKLAIGAWKSNQDAGMPWWRG